MFLPGWSIPFSMEHLIHIRYLQSLRLFLGHKYLQQKKKKKDDPIKITMTTKARTMATKQPVKRKAGGKENWH